MASLEYYLEALRDRRPGREDILDITRSSLAALRYWPLPDRNAVEPAPFAAQPVEREPVAMQAEALQPERIEIPVQPAAPAAGTVPVPLPDFTFDPSPVAPAPEVVDNRLMFGALGSAALDAATAPLSVQAAAEAPLVFAASSAPAPDVPQWDLAPFHPDADPLASADDERSPPFASFDPVSFEQDDAGQGAAAQWTLSEAVPSARADAVAVDADEDADATAGIDADAYAAPVYKTVDAEN
ncbi:hypothetical protein G6F60_013557 [Rhizopus arrhizus]|nr:hypothetical protein G6F60_013557 [Rhizopus arrhizus]